jgi:ABC-type Fe3+-hydroxamate transport system substrate-binding protein
MVRTRREYLRGSAAALGTAAFAGCTARGGNEAGSDEATSDGTETTSTGTTGTTAETTTTAESGPYTASISPVGEVEFESVPEDVFAVFPGYADMALALGQDHKLSSVYVPEMTGTTLNHYCERLPGVSFAWEGLSDPLSGGLSKEALVAADSDVHLADPAWASTQDGWSRTDVDDIAEQVGPWFGNFYSGTQNSVPGGYPDYGFYTLWELFGRVSEVFRERARFEALNGIHEAMVADIESRLPPEEERPTAVRATLAADGESFYTYHLNEPGYWLADTRPLGARDAFAEQDWGGLWGTVDFETMAEADPDVFLHLWGLTPSYSMATTRRTLDEHPLGSRLTAVEEERVYPAGMRYQGPIMNLFQTEMGAKQLYPEVFGEWPRYEDGEPYPEIPESEWLFDREEVAEIVAGSA